MSISKKIEDIFYNYVIIIVKNFRENFGIAEYFGVKNPPFSPLLRGR